MSAGGIGVTPVYPQFARQGMVLTCHPLAASAGMQLLQAGGNAVDAALAAVWTEMVVLPMATGMGADVLALVWEREADGPEVLLGLGPAPSGATVQAAHAEGFTDTLPRDSIFAASVPGSVDGLETLRERGARLSREMHLASARHYAEMGFALSRRGARLIERARLRERGGEPILQALAPDGAVQPGALIRQPDLARTLRDIAAAGRAGFYDGAFGDALIRFSRLQRGWFTPDDRHGGFSRWVKPWRCEVPRLGTLFGTPAPTAGRVVAAAMALMEQVRDSRVRTGQANCGGQWGRAGSPGTDGPDGMDLVARARSMALQVRDEAGDIGLETLLAQPEQLAMAAQRLADGHYSHWTPTGTGTSLVVTADADGTLVAVMHSLSGVNFGSAQLVPGTGVVLNSRLARHTPVADLHPGLVPKTTLNLVAVRDADGSRIVGGTPGGDQQSLWVLQLLCRLQNGWPLADAVGAPRWWDAGSRRALTVEDRLSAADIEALTDLGWVVDRVPPWGASGGYQVVRESPGTLCGVSDPRIEGGFVVW